VASAGGYEITGSDERWIGKDNTIHVWQVDSGKEVLVLEGFEGIITGLTWSSDMRLLASGSEDGTVRLWKVK
jgi:WD40 repeat protein